MRRIIYSYRKFWTAIGVLNQCTADIKDVHHFIVGASRTQLDTNGVLLAVSLLRRQCGIEILEACSVANYNPKLEGQ